MKVMIMSKSGSKGRRAQIDLTRPSPAFKHTRVMTRLERSGAFFLQGVCHPGRLPRRGLAGPTQKSSMQYQRDHERP